MTTPTVLRSAEPDQVADAGLAALAHIARLTPELARMRRRPTGATLEA